MFRKNTGHRVIFFVRAAKILCLDALEMWQYLLTRLDLAIYLFRQALHKTRCLLSLIVTGWLASAVIKHTLEV